MSDLLSFFFFFFRKRKMRAILANLICLHCVVHWQVLSCPRAWTKDLLTTKNNHCEWTLSKQTSRFTLSVPLPFKELVEFDTKTIYLHIWNICRVTSTRFSSAEDEFARREKWKTSVKAHFTAFGLFLLQKTKIKNKLSFKDWCTSYLSLKHQCKAKKPDLPLYSLNVRKGNVWQSARRNSILPANVCWACPTCCTMERNRVHHVVLSEKQQ